MDIDDITNYKPVLNKSKHDKLKITVSGVYDQFKAFKKTKQYKMLINNDIKVVFKAKQIEHDTHVPISENKTETVFSDILSKIVNNKKDIYLNDMYNLIIHNKS